MITSCYCGISSVGRAIALHAKGRGFEPSIPHTLTDLSKNILYEDADIVVLNKPAGIIVHPDGRTIEPSVSEWFLKQYPESKYVGEPLGDIERPGVVHRIDRETSGVLLLAKTKKGHSVLKKQFQNREVEKVYHLFVHGNLQDDRGTINLPIGRSASNFRKRSTQRGARGEMREAITHFQVLKRADNKLITFVEAKPKTGRMHQIRVHFQALHHPVVSDALYAPRKSKLLGFERLALHARSISFKTVGGKKVTIEAPYATDFQKAIKTLV